jgi:ABC-type bacteriocin/lantibiotic exporter with double-glycine peptidase domain
MKVLFNTLDKKIKIRINLIFIMSLVTVLLETLSIVSIFPVIKTIFQPDFLIEKISFIKFNISHQDTIFYLIIIMVLIFLMKNIILFYFSLLTSKFINFATVDLTTKYFDRYLSLDYVSFIKYNSSYYVRNVIENINTLFGVYLKCIITLVVELVLMIMLLSVLFTLDKKATTYFLLIFFIVGSVIYYIFKNKLRKYGLNINEYYTKKLIDLNQGFTSFKEIQLTESKNFFVRSFYSNLRNIALIGYRVDAIGSLPKSILEVTGVTVVMIFIYLNISNVENSNDYFATLTLFALSGFRMMPSVNRILSSINRIRYAGPTIQILEDELKRFQDSKINDKLLENKNINISFCKEILVKNLSFGYNDESFLFKNINLKFQKGSVNVIFGVSGCGKTTLINILLGFLKPKKGDILSDNINVFQNLSSWKSNLAFVPQEINLGDEKIISNIAYGVNAEKINKDKIYKILDILNMRSFIDSLPQKLNTKTGEKAFKISGGQRQRIALARCLYREKKIIILDEATSALDKNTELEILKKIKEHYNDTTIILVTHRDYLKDFADKVYRFDGVGGIIEEK